jgi:hypothetical protein
MNNNKNHKPHGLWMALCCLIPIFLMAVLFSFNIQGLVLKSVLGGLLILACPLGHILMMVFMGKDHNHGQKNSENEEIKQSCH